MSAALQTIASLELLFDRVRLLVPGGEDWTPVEMSAEASAPGLRLATLKGPAGGTVTFMRVQYEMNVNFRQACRVMRPEMFFHRRRPEFDDMIAQCDVEDLLAPGDALAWVQMRPMTPAAQRTASLINTSGAYQESLKGHSGESTTLKVRMTVRRDFPEVGKYAVVCVPRHPESDQLLEEWGLLKATAGVVEPSDRDPNCVVITQVRQLTQVPDWAVALAAPQHFLRQFKRMVQLATHLPEPERQLSDRTDPDYIVVSLGRCARGPPLLPAPQLDEEGISFHSCWQPFGEEQAGFTLTMYLRAFLSRLGLEDVVVNDSLDGRYLVPYQAVVWREAWIQIWTVLEQPYKVQRAVYRQQRGGRRAPALSLDVEARFLSGCTSGVAASDEPLRIPVKGTFVHFTSGEDATPARPRAGSDPDIERMASDPAVMAH